MGKITSIVKYGNNSANNKWDTLDEWQKNAHPWTVTLKYDRRQMTLEFWTGQGTTTDPQTADVVFCIANDSTSYENAPSFEEWALDMGYDQDSRKAYKIYRTVERQTERFRQLLDEDYDKVIQMSEEVLAQICK